MDIEVRLGRMEKRCRVLGRVIAVLVAGFSFVVIGGLAKEPELQDLVGKSLKLQTEDGRVWLVARPVESGGQVQLLSTPTVPSFGPGPGIMLYSGQDNWYLGILTDEGEAEVQPRALFAIQNQHPRLWLCPAEGPPCIDMGEAEGGSGWIGISNRETRNVWSAPPGIAEKAQAEKEEGD